MMHSIDARAVWMDDTQECRRLYRQFATTFRALRQGQPTNMMKGIRHEA
jgi:hypothetical protein